MSYPYPLSLQSLETSGITGCVVNSYEREQMMQARIPSILSDFFKWRIKSQHLQAFLSLMNKHCVLPDKHLLAIENNSLCLLLFLMVVKKVYKNEYVYFLAQCIRFINFYNKPKNVPIHARMIKHTRIVVVLTFFPNSQYMIPKAVSGRRHGII